MNYAPFKEISGHVCKSVKVYVAIFQMNSRLIAMTSNINYLMIPKISLCRYEIIKVMLEIGFMKYMAIYNIALMKFFKPVE